MARPGRKRLPRFCNRQELSPKNHGNAAKSQRT